MKYYRIYFLAFDGKIDGRPAEMEAESEDAAVMRALVADRNLYGAEVWCGATLIRRVDQGSAQPAFITPGDRAGQADLQKR